MKIIHTHNMETVKEIITHPAIWPLVADDECPPAEAWEPQDVEGTYHLIAMDSGVSWDRTNLLYTGSLTPTAEAIAIGTFYLHPINSVTFQGHQAILPEWRGWQGLEALKCMFQWMWGNTKARKIVGFTPANNPAAIRHAKLAGMKAEGRITAAYLENGRLIDMHIMGISKGN